MKKIVSAICLMAIVFFYGCGSKSGGRKILVFTKTKGYHHESIPAGVAAIEKLGKENDFSVDTTSDAGVFNDDDLKQYRAVIFVSTTGNILNSDQQVAFERYIEAGGGFMGIHAAADAEYNWAWYNRLVGAYFKSHPGNPNVRKATVVDTSTDFIARKGFRKNGNAPMNGIIIKISLADLNVIAKLR